MGLVREASLRGVRGEAVSSDGSTAAHRTPAWPGCRCDIDSLVSNIWSGLKMRSW